eukprot:tig00020616_g12267.t1
MQLESLPLDVLAHIAGCLTTFSDVLNFASACKALRAAAAAAEVALRVTAARELGPEMLERSLSTLRRLRVNIAALDARETTLTAASLEVLAGQQRLKCLLAADLRGGGEITLPASLESLGGTTKLLVCAAPASLRVVAAVNAKWDQPLLERLREAARGRCQFLFLGGARMTEGALRELPALFAELPALRAVDVTCAEQRVAREVRRALAALERDVLVLDMEFQHARKSFDAHVRPHVGAEVTSLALAAANGHKHALLHLAAERGDGECVRWLLRAGANALAKDDAGCTPLFVAAEVGHAGVVDVLARHAPASIESRNHNLETPLYIAALKGHLAAVRTLLGRGAAVDGSDWNGWSCLQAACINRNHHAEVVRELIDGGADVAAPNRYGTTALHIAARGGFGEAVRLLVDAGAPVDARDESGHAPLDLCKSEEIAALLVSRGAVPAPPAPASRSKRRPRPPAPRGAGRRNAPG